jgi:hypothetical protein
VALVQAWFKPEPHGAASQKTIFFIVIDVKTSNLTILVMTSRKDEEKLLINKVNIINTGIADFGMKMSLRSSYNRLRAQNLCEYVTGISHPAIIINMNAVRSSSLGCKC